MTVNRTEADSIIDAMRDLADAETHFFEEPGEQQSAALIVPQGKKVVSVKPFLDEFLRRPRRRTGTAIFTDLASFLEHCNRFKGMNSVIFANDDCQSPSLTSVLDYHEAGDDESAGTHFGEHRGRYDFPLDETWLAWEAAEKAGSLSMIDFAEFLEDRIGDALEPLGPYIEGEPEADTRLRATIEKLGGVLASPAKLLELSRGFRVNEDSRTTVAQVLHSGEVTLNFQRQNTDEKGDPLRVPNMFLIQTPVFRNGPLYRVPVRLRYRATGGTVKWAVLRLRPDRYFQDALSDALATASASTQLPVLLGSPET